MEGGVYLRNYTLMYKGGSPLTGKDMVLSGKKHLSLEQHNQNSVSNVIGSGNSQFSSIDGATRDAGFEGGLLFPRLPTYPKTNINSRGLGMEVNAGRLKTRSKRQWTIWEDRKLFNLVNGFEVQKWSKIADKMVHRTGKQCRERWLNHLRPDIKKDSWSKEEERMLVDAHRDFGNKWSKIAQRIPGRTENSIKNHWYATKRRRKDQIGSSQLSLLREYITSQSSSANCISTTNSAISEDPLIQPSISSPKSTSDVYPHLISTKQDDELNFMQSFLGEYLNDPIVEATPSQDATNSQGVLPDLDMTYMYPDLTLPYLFDGATLPSSIHYSYWNIDIGLEMSRECTFSTVEKERGI